MVEVGDVQQQFNFLVGRLLPSSTSGNNGCAHPVHPACRTLGPG